MVLQVVCIFVSGHMSLLKVVLRCFDWILFNLLVFLWRRPVKCPCLWGNHEIMNFVYLSAQMTTTERFHVAMIFNKRIVRSCQYGEVDIRICVYQVTPRQYAHL